MKKTNIISFSILAVLNCALGLLLIRLPDAADLESGLGPLATLDFMMKFIFYFYWWPFLVSALAVAGLIASCRTAKRQRQLSVALIATLFLDIIMVCVTGMSTTVTGVMYFYNQM
jgi:hypothetical protein